MKDNIEIVKGIEKEFNGKKYVTSEVRIKRLCGYGVITFKTPISVFVTIEEGEKEARFYYDFGMSDRVSIVKEDNFLWNYIDNPECDPLLTTVASIKYDIEHAFLHVDIDPNFGHVHWVLRSELKDRVDKMLEWYELEDQQEVQTTFDFYID